MTDQRYNFKKLVSTMASLRGKKFTEIADDLDRDSSEISNVLSRRFSARKLENDLAEMTKDEIKEFFREVLGELYDSHSDAVEKIVDQALKKHRKLKPTNS